jgi:acyl carrier protein
MADRIDKMVRGAVAEILGDDPARIPDETVLTGFNAELKSRELVVLMLEIEDRVVQEFGIEFDWNADSIAQDTRIRMRTVGSLIKFVNERVKSAVKGT